MYISRQKSAKIMRQCTTSRYTSVQVLIFLYKLCSAENIEFCWFRLNVSLVFLKQLYRQQFDISFKVIQIKHAVSVSLLIEVRHNTLTCIVFLLWETIWVNAEKYIQTVIFLSMPFDPLSHLIGSAILLFLWLSHLFTVWTRTKSAN